ncbi:hypothetical protein GCM10027415_09450 [Humibacter ginsengisoli]
MPWSADFSFWSSSASFVWLNVNVPFNDAELFDEVVEGVDAADFEQAARPVTRSSAVATAAILVVIFIVHFLLV